MELLRSIGAFAWGVFRRFYFWLPAFLLDPFDIYNQFLRTRLFGPCSPEIEMASDFFPYALGIGLVWAVIMTYHELRVGTGRSKKIVKGLKKLYLEGEKFIYEKISNDEEFQSYKKKMFEWANSTSQWVLKNMGEEASSNFRDKQNIMPFSHDNDYNDEHMGYINFVSKLRNNLLRLIDSPEWDRDG